MSRDTYRFKVGTFDCMAVNDGIHVYKASQYFANVPPDQVEPVLRERNIEPERILSPFTCLLVNTGQHLVLIDTGAGDFTPSVGRLLPRLQAEGIQPADIDTVILTHAHPDHIGGNTDGKGQPAFTNARYVLFKDEWDYWMSGRDLGPLNNSMIGFAQKNLPPIQGQLDLIQGEAEVVPGIHALPAPGHTPGHMAVLVASDSEQLLYISDTVLHPLHLEKPDWRPIFHVDHDQADATRRRLFDQAAAEWALVLAFHFYPTPGLGYVTRQGEGWQWQPIDTTG